MADIQEKTGVPTGTNVLHPFTGKPVPLWVADYVLMSYGTGVVMGVPAHDQRDQDFAKKYKIKNVVLFPDSGNKILKTLRQGSGQNLRILKTKSMKEAVAFAYQHTTKGKICLLSCASPSYSLWKNFEEKGQEFKAAVRKQGKI